MMNKLTLCVLCFVLVTTSQHAYAYFDPGTGSMLIQLLIAACGGVFVFFRRMLFGIRECRLFGSNDNGAMLKCYYLSASIGVFVALFYSSHNVSGLTIFSFIVNTLLFVLFSILLTVAFALALRGRKNQVKAIHGLLFLLFVYYMRVPVVDFMQVIYIRIFAQPPEFFVVIIFVVLLAIYFFFLGWKLSRYTIWVVIILSIMSLYYVSFAYKQTRKVSPSYVNGNTGDEALQLIDREIVFQRRPNVYFIVFDAHTNREGLEAVGLPVYPQLTEYLHKKGFYTYDTFYTNFQATLNAMSVFFNMGIQFLGDNLYNTPQNIKQKIVAGSGLVYNLFKNNQYTTNIITDEAGKHRLTPLKSYLIGDFCFADYCLHDQDEAPHSYHIFNTVVLNGLLTRAINLPSSSLHSQSTLNLRKIISVKEKKFVYSHILSPYHAPDIKTDGRVVCDEKMEAKKYAVRLKHAHSLMGHITDMIEESDPSALIVLASDHGPFILNHCSRNAPLLTREEVVERQGAFLAIRWGEDYDGRYDEDIKSSANLFRYVFSYLLGHEKLLLNKPDDDAFYHYKGEVIKSIDDGVILPPPAAELKGND